MFANFKSGNQQILVPLNWVRNFNLQSFLNYGPVAKQTQLVFYSNDKARAPNFDLPPSNPNAFWYNLDNGYDACYNGRVESIFGMYFYLDLNVQLIYSYSTNYIIFMSLRLFGILENENKSLEAAVDRRIIKLEKVVSYQYNSIKMMHIDLEGIVIDLDTLHDAQIILDEEFDQIVGEDTAAMVNENQNIDAEQEEVVQFLAQIGEEAAAVMVNESHASDAEQEVQLLAKIGEETAPAMVDENYDANTEQASEQAVQMANHNQMSLNGPIDSFSGGLHYEENVSVKTRKCG